jgi:integral membrane protein
MKSSVKMFRIVAFLEGVSFLLLMGITMPLKYFYAMPMPNKIVGMAHGVLVVAFIFYLLQVRAEKNWGFKLTALAFLASLVPFGTFILDAKVLKPLDQPSQK